MALIRFWRACRSLSWRNSMGEDQSALGNRRCVVCSAVLPEGAKRQVCSSGCGLVNLVPRNPDGPLPASWPLVMVIALYFALFNQALVASMVWVKAQGGLLEDADKFATISLGIGVFWALLVIYVLLKIRIFQFIDGIILSAAIVVAVFPWSDVLLGLPSHGFALQFALGNLVFGAWLGRKLGLLRA